MSAGCATEADAGAVDEAAAGDENVGKVSSAAVAYNNASFIRTSNLICLDVPRYGNGVPITQWTCHGGDNQIFYFERRNGYFQIRNKATNLCVDVSGWSTAGGAKLIQWDCHGGANQLWYEYDSGFVNVNSGQMMDVPSNTNASGVQLQQWWHNGSPAQKFYPRY